MATKEDQQYARTSAQVARVRRLYSQIGEPLPADVIIDLHRHLGRLLEAVSPSPASRARREDQAERLRRAPVKN